LIALEEEHQGRLDDIQRLDRPTDGSEDRKGSANQAECESDMDKEVLIPGLERRTAHIQRTLPNTCCSSVFTRHNTNSQTALFVGPSLIIVPSTSWMTSCANQWTFQVISTTSSNVWWQLRGVERRIYSRWSRPFFVGKKLTDELSKRRSEELVISDRRTHWSKKIGAKNIEW